MVFTGRRRLYSFGESPILGYSSSTTFDYTFTSDISNFEVGGDSVSVSHPDGSFEFAGNSNNMKFGTTSMMYFNNPQGNYVGHEMSVASDVMCYTNAQTDLIRCRGSNLYGRLGYGSSSTANTGTSFVTGKFKSFFVSYINVTNKRTKNS